MSATVVTILTLVQAMDCLATYKIGTWLANATPVANYRSQRQVGNMTVPTGCTLIWTNQQDEIIDWCDTYPLDKCGSWTGEVPNEIPNTDELSY